MDDSSGFPHGDIVTTATAPTPTGACTAIGGWSNYDEFGAPTSTTIAQTGTADAAGYGWLGAKQRSTTTASAGLTLMGDRYYDSATGRFTSLDPVPGGNANAYTDPTDPINQSDLNGRMFTPYDGGGGGGESGLGGISGGGGCSFCAGTFWGAVSFLSFRSYVDAAGAALTLQVPSAVHEALVGSGSNAAKGAARSVYAGKRRPSAAAFGTARRVVGRPLGRAAVRVFATPVGVVATILDYLHTSDDRNPFRVRTRGSVLAPGR